jgi:hypothetical protein
MWPCTCEYWQSTDQSGPAANDFLGDDKMLRVLPALCCCILGCASRQDMVRGHAEVLSWSPDARVLRLCDSKLEYQLGVFAANAEGTGARDIERLLDAQAGPMLVEVIAFPAALPSGWKPAPGVAGVMNVTSIKPIARSSCPSR